MNSIKRVLLALAFTTLILPTDGFSSILNLIKTPELGLRISSPALLTNSGLLIFHSQSPNQQITTYSLDLESFETHELLSLDSSLFRPIPYVKSLFELSTGQIIYNTRVTTSNGAEKTQLYLSNGTEPFVPLASPLNGFTQFASIIDGVFFHRSDSQLLVTDGMTTVTYETSGIVFPSCFFDVNHFVITQYGGDNNDTMYQYKDGEITPLFSETNITRVDQTTKNSTSCLFKVDVGINEFKYLYLNINGQSRTLDRNDDWIVTMGEHYLAKTKRDGIFILPKLTKLNQNLEELASSGLNDGDYYTVRMKPNGEGFWLKTTDSDESNWAYYDQMLNINFNSAVPSKEFEFGLFVSTEREVLLHNTGMEVFNEGDLQGELTYKPGAWRQYITNQNKSQAILLTDEMYLIEDKPRVSDLMNGSWYDTAYQNQGLSISPGIRGDGSRYIFLTFYLYKDNEPLWLAGVSNYTPGQKEITIELLEFQGANYLDNMVTPDSTVVGSIRLAFQNCGAVSGVFEYNSQPTTLNFNRVDDSSFQSRCF